MSANSPTEICNLALSWVAGNRLTSLDDDESTEAILCRANYDMSRRALLEEREWTFAIRRTQLSRLNSEPPFGYMYWYQLPSDCLNVMDVLDANGQDVQHRVEDNKILCNDAELYIRYKFDLNNTTRWTNLFTHALAAHVAFKIAIPLTENRSLMADMLQLFEAYLEKAVSTDALQGSRERLKRSQQERVRRHHVGFD